MAAFETPFAYALNRLLGTESWARERLAPFAGETVELRAPPLPAVRLAILEGGRLAPGTQASLTLTLRSGALAALARGASSRPSSTAYSMNPSPRRRAASACQAAKSRSVCAMVWASASPNTLDRSSSKSQRRWRARCSTSCASRALPSMSTARMNSSSPRAQFAAFAGEVAQLRDALERLEKRLERLP